MVVAFQAPGSFRPGFPDAPDTRAISNEPTGRTFSATRFLRQALVCSVP